MSRLLIAKSLLAAVLLSGCATTPMGPTAMVLPGQGKPFGQFAQDQSMCKQFADGEVNGGATMSNLKEFGVAAVTTTLGAGLGAAVRGGRGAGIGGAIGALGGSAMAANGSGHDQRGLQGRYDMAYTQCMYAHGNQIAGVPQSAPRLASGPGYSQPGQIH